MLALKPTDGNHWIICIIVHFYCHRWLRLSGSNLRSGDKECNYFPQMQMGSFESIGCESSYFSPPSKIQWNFISCYSSQRNEFPKRLAQCSDLRHWRDCSADIVGAIIEAASICLFSILASDGESVKGRNQGLGYVSLCVSVAVSGGLQSRAHCAWQLRWHTHFVGTLTSGDSWLPTFADSWQFNSYARPATISCYFLTTSAKMVQCAKLEYAFPHH